MIQGFVHPALAFGALLALVPLIIHLLNRRRHKPLAWGAMRFVELAYKKTRRRMQMENLLLLLLRMAAVGAIAFAVARPFAGRGALGALTENSQDLVLLLDGSASTGYREDVETVYGRIVRRAQTLVEELQPGRGDRVHVLLLGKTTRLIAWPTPDKALSVLSTLDHPLDEPLALDAGLAELERLVEDGEILDLAQTEVRLLTDLQRNSFLPDLNSDQPPAWWERLDRLQAQGLTIHVEDLGPIGSTPQNLSVTDVEVLGTPRGPKEAGVRLFNHSNLPQAGVRVSLSLDGNRLPSRRVDLEPRSQAEVIFPLGDLDSGAHRLDAALEGDRLAVDDHRAQVVNIPAPARVLLVNGSPAERIELDGVAFLRLALEGGGPEEAQSPFEVREVNLGEFEGSSLDLANFDVIWLAGTPPPSVATATRLRERVAQGAALVVSAGPQMGTAALWNERLFDASGAGLAPGEWLQRVSVARQGDYYRIDEFAGDHPILELFEDTSLRPLLIGVPFSDFVGFAPESGAKVLARLDDQSRSPLLIEKPFGSGRVFFWTSSINESWTLLPQAARTFIPLVFEWLRYAARADITTRSIEPGDSIRLEVDAFPRNPELERPDGSRRMLEGDPIALGGDRYALPSIPPEDTRAVGLYQVHVEGGRSVPFAAVLDPREGDLARVTTNEQGDLHPALSLQQTSGPAANPVQSTQSGEIWRSLAWIALICLAAESLWAAWLGRKRSVA
ncbi:MAG: BatA domain-containing protein [Planctomycetota bacterium]